MSFSISFPHVLGASYSQRIPWTVQVPFIVDRKFPRLEDTHLATHNLNIHIGKSHILKDVNVEIPQNKITCIIGPSGCGKTTLLRTFNRLVDSIEGVKIDGEVNLGKQDVVAAGPSQMTELRRNIGLVPQRPCPLPMSIYDNIAYGCKIHGVRGKRKLDLVVRHYLEAVGLWEEVKDRLHTPAIKLSGGQQLVAFATMQIQTTILPCQRIISSAQFLQTVGTLPLVSHQYIIIAAHPHNNAVVGA